MARPFDYNDAIAEIICSKIDDDDESLVWVKENIERLERARRERRDLAA